MVAMKATLGSLGIGDTFLAKYQIRGLLGRGGQATVFHSYDTYIDRDVAIKIMADTSDSKREHSRRAQMEARVLCKLHHPNIVNVFDAGATEDGLIYIIMELLRGRTLREVIRHVHKVTVFEALAMGAQIADGVELAHQQHVIHRDLKPENIFVVDGNAVKVLDFGIAKFLTLTGITTQRDTLQGTMWYISPEHVQGFGVTARSDIYALGSILYEIIAGMPPCLIGLQEITTQSVAYSQISRMPPQLHELVPSVPQHVGRVIYRMLMKEPAKRYGSMKEVADALRGASKRLQAEHNGAPLELRNLWHVPDAPAADMDAPPNALDAADTLEDPSKPVMQPTIEVRSQPQEKPLAARTPAVLEAGPAESGVNLPNSVVGSVSRSPAPPAVAAERAPIGGHALAVATTVFFSQRWSVVALAVVLGTAAGLGIGASGWHPSAGVVNNVRPPQAAKGAPAPGLQEPSAAPLLVPSQKPKIERAANSPAAVPSAIAQAALPEAMAEAQPTATNQRDPIPSAALTSRKQIDVSSLKEKGNSTVTQSRGSKRTDLKSTDDSKARPPVVRPPYSGIDLD
jgi:serine/threonine protein kinase